MLTTLSEAATATINLNDFSPSAVAVMLRWMYLNQTLNPAADDEKTAVLGRVVSDLTGVRHLFDLFVVADKYNIPQLSARVGLRLSQMTKFLVGRCDNMEDDKQTSKNDLAWLLENRFEGGEVPVELENLVVKTIADRTKQISESVFIQDQIQRHSALARLLALRLARCCKEVRCFTREVAAQLQRSVRNGGSNERAAATSAE